MYLKHWTHSFLARGETWFRGAAAWFALVSTSAIAAAQITVYQPAPLTGQIAELETEVPVDSTFILRGTLPIPRNTFVPGGARTMKVVDWNGTALTTQCEVVTRFAGAGGSGGHAEVVELIARVSRDPAWLPGNHAKYRVVLASDTVQPAPTSPTLADLINVTSSVPSNIQGLIGATHSIVIQAIDPRGKRYLMYPFKAGNWKAYRYGAEMTTLRSYGVLKPDFTLASGEYPHMMGVHAYLTTRDSDPALMLDLRVHNGFDNFDATTTDDDHLGLMYWKRLDLLILQSGSQNWRPQFEFADPYCYVNGQTITTTTINHGGVQLTYDVFPIVNEQAVLPNGLVPMHAMGYKMQFHRRLGIAAAADQTALRRILDLDGIAFSAEGTMPTGAEQYSWFNNLVGRYFPQRQVLPTLTFNYLPDTGSPCTGTTSLTALRCEMDARFNNIVNALATNVPVSTGYEYDTAPAQLGWARPYGYLGGDAVSGGGISFLEGDRAIAAAWRNELRNISLKHRLTAERQPTQIWDLAGDPTYLEKWLFQDASGFPNPNLPGSPNCVSPFDFVVNWSPSFPTGQPFAPTVTNWIQNQFVAARNLYPDYQTSATPALNLFQYTPNDQAHLVRYTRFPLALMWIANDPIAKDDLRNQGELGRMQLTEYPRYNSGGYVQQESLFARNQFIGLYPAWGLNVGRTEGWTLNAANALYAMANDADRVRLRYWFQNVVDTLTVGMLHASDPCFVDATSTPYSWGFLSVYGGNDPNVCGQFWGTPAPCPNSRQPFEEMIIQNGLRGMMQGNYNAAETTYANIVALLHDSYLGVIAPVAFNEAGGVIFNRQAVTWSSPLGTAPVYNFDSTFCGPPGPGDIDMYSLPTYWQPSGTSYHYFASCLSDAWAVTGDVEFLKKACAYWGITPGANPAAQLKAAIEADTNFNPTNHSLGQYDTWPNRAALLGRMQP